MAINFIPNDPLASGGPPMRRKTPRANRPSSRAGFTFVAHQPAALYQPGTAAFLFWQSREAALAAVATYETLAGRKVTAWARSSTPRRLDLQPNAGEDLNAYYDGRSLSFFAYTTGAKTTFSGASTDVLAHEAGHALLDQAHPQLWDSSFTETNAFHEAFGDCTALVTALHDRLTREAVRTALDRQNFVESLAEDLSDGVRRALGASHPASAPRHAWNSFRWQLPSTLPSSGPPSVLSAEIHSFGRIFVGCFYDTIRNILRARIGAGKTPTQQQLWQAVRSAGILLVRAAAEAPETARFFQSVGRTMVLVDQSLNGGANGPAIHDGFARHGVALGTAAMLAPTAALAGNPPALGRGSGRGVLSPAALADLRRRIGAAPGASITVRPTVIAGQRVAHAAHLREIPLAKLDRRLKGVVTLVPEPVLLGSADRTVAILGALPEAAATADEVNAFVASLLAADRIAFAPEDVKGGIGSAVKRDRRKRLPTHAVHALRGRRVLRRVRFSCGEF
jgi:hypothetical protein